MFWRFLFRLLLFQTKRSELEANELTVVMTNYEARLSLPMFFFIIFFPYFLAILVESLYVTGLQMLPFIFPTSNQIIIPL